MTFLYYSEDSFFYYVWKPHGIASTFGIQKSILDIISLGEAQQEGKYDYSFLSKEKMDLEASQIKDILADKKVAEFAGPTLSHLLSSGRDHSYYLFEYLTRMFSREEEYGLVNRLDNDTAGFLYFAKTPEIKEKYKKLQKSNAFYKLYVCDVYGKVSLEKTRDKISGVQQSHYEEWSGLTIDFPIVHSKSDSARMSVVANGGAGFDAANGFGTDRKTVLIPVSYNKHADTTRCCVVIQRGARHQIRVHLATIGYPIVGDQLYAGKRLHNCKNSLSLLHGGGESLMVDTARKQDSFLHLWCVGLKYPCNLDVDMYT